MTLVDDLVVGTTADSLLPRGFFDGLALMQVGLAKMMDADIDTQNVHEALELVTEVQTMSRQMDAVENKMIDSIDRTDVYAVDGHRTAKVMVAHVGKLSGADADARRKTMRALRVLPKVRVAYENGEISTSMVNRLGLAYANPRVRKLMAEADSWFLEHARNDTYEFFHLVVTEWVKLADEDGAESREARAERNRKHALIQNDDGSWRWSGSSGGFDGAISNDVFEAFEKIEFDIDWQWTVAEYGDEACPDRMPRTPAQRRADAFAKIHVYAAKGLAADGGPNIVTDIVIDQETVERETAKLIGEDAGPDDPTRASSDVPP